MLGPHHRAERTASAARPHIVRRLLPARADASRLAQRRTDPPVQSNRLSWVASWPTPISAVSIISTNDTRPDGRRSTGLRQTGVVRACHCAGWRSAPEPARRDHFDVDIGSTWHGRRSTDAQAGWHRSSGSSDIGKGQLPKAKRSPSNNSSPSLAHEHPRRSAAWETGRR